MSPLDQPVDDDSDPGKYARLDRLAAEFAARYRRGERPTLEEYALRHPELAEEIRDLFPAMVGLEKAEEIRKDQSGGESLASAPALSQVGDFRILREVGRGGMGVVYEAEQISLGRQVALKVLPAGPRRDAKALERFRHEARAAARLHHTNSVPVFEVGQDGSDRRMMLMFIGCDEWIMQPPEIPIGQSCSRIDPIGLGCRLGTADSAPPQLRTLSISSPTHTAAV
jgi:eukaryotic-like serine/threonine-protein kinase